MKLYFSNFFGVSRENIENYGAFDISLINDLPLFVDPFLLFNSNKPKYRVLHDEIIKYVTFLKDISDQEGIRKGLLKSWFYFPEIKQTWLGYSKIGNDGRGLRRVFAEALNRNLHTVFTDFGQEEITQGSHLEKLCLIKDGVGRDNISDFTTNLIKSFLCEYTETFSKKYIKQEFLSEIMVEKVEFNYNTRTWMSKKFTLPILCSDYVLLTPKEILTKDETWINKKEMIEDFSGIVNSITNEQLRAQLNDYLMRLLPTNPKKNELREAIFKTIQKYPEYIDHFIKYKEDTGDRATNISSARVAETQDIFVTKVEQIVCQLFEKSNFYNISHDTFDETKKRILFLKQAIENNDVYRLFYHNGQPIKRESDLQLMFRLTWYATASDVNAEVNNGRGAVDYKISRGGADSTLVEFKLASNTKLKQNLKHQVEIYEQANQTKKSFKVILYFTYDELKRIQKTLKELGLEESDSIILIDARDDNKESASKVKERVA